MPRIATIGQARHTTLNSTTMDQPLVFIHLSDIHFNKKWLDHYELDRDLRDQLEKDVVRVRDRFQAVQGILISGDIAFAGRKEEYVAARTWLKRLCELARCREHAVWCVPGNHDADRAKHESSPLLQDLHDRLRPADPAEVDDLIARYLRDETACPLLFNPIEVYNLEFAAHFRCTSGLAPLAWQHDLQLNDGSKLRIHGINSVLAFDGTDNFGDRKLIVGTVQARPLEENGVTYLTMAHHPPEWLIDYDTVHLSLTNRARVQLFGHKHIHRIEHINNSLRIGAGAVHPSRKEKNWLPRYNWIALSVRDTRDGRFLDVDVSPRVWREEDTAFVPDYAACGGKESHVYNLALEPWTAPAPVVGVPVPIQVSSPSASPNPAGNATMDKMDANDAARTLTYRFLDLPHVVRIEIAQQLGLYADEDEGLRNPELLDRIFQRATDQRRLGQLWEQVESRHDDGQNPVNPYCGH